MSPQAVQKEVALQDFALELREFPESAFEHTQEIVDFLTATRVAPHTLTPFLSWDGQHYTRNLIDKTPLYELLAICWEVGMKSSIHNHKDQNCWMATPVGRLSVCNYRVLDEDLASHRCNIVPTDVVEINASNPVAVDPANPVHDVRNPREFGERAVSLHVYSRPFDSCIVYSVDQHSCGEIGLHYNSMYGKPVRD